MKVSHERLGEVQLPDFLLVGAAKSATSSLHLYLNQHPEIRMPDIKESWFFSFLDEPPAYTSPGVLNSVVSRLEDYVRLFDGAAPTQKLGDASPSYLYTYEDAIRNIRAVYPPERLAALRIVISLREPVSRAFSQYWTFKRFDQEPLPFEQATDASVIARRLADNWNIFYDYTGFGRYYEQVKAYLDAFGRERVLVVLYDDIEKDPVAVCRSIFAFLGVDAEFVPNVRFKYNNLTGEARVKWPLRVLTSRNPIKRLVAAVIPKPVRQMILYGTGKLLLKRGALSDSSRQALTRAFADDVVRLEGLIGRDLTHWRGGH